MSMENFLSFSPIQFGIVSHLLSYGYAIMLASLVYFGVTAWMVAPKYRITNYLSMVVMVSAFVILYHQYTSWTWSFVYDPWLGEFIKDPSKIFSNGYRYLNRLIDVPTLLLQLTFVISVPALLAWKTRLWFVISWALMIITWYIGQYYEVAENRMMFWIFFVISCLFFVHVYRLLYQVIASAKKDKKIEKSEQYLVNLIRYIFLGAWMLYPIAYLMPIISNSAEGVVIRQLLFTIADVTSKVVYWVVLGYLAQQLSIQEWYDYKKQQ